MLHRLNRREFIALCGGAAAWPLAARAQQPAVPVIGCMLGKQLEIALDVVPGATKVGVLVNDDDPSGLLQRREADRHPAGAQ